MNFKFIRKLMFCAVVMLLGVSNVSAQEMVMNHIGIKNLSQYASVQNNQTTSSSGVVRVTQTTDISQQSGKINRAFAIDVLAELKKSINENKSSDYELVDESIVDVVYNRFLATASVVETDQIAQAKESVLLLLTNKK